jgi:hypothetical protein
MAKFKSWKVATAIVAAQALTLASLVLLDPMGIMIGASEAGGPNFYWPLIIFYLLIFPYISISQFFGHGVAAQITAWLITDWYFYYICALGVNAITAILRIR